jgi:type II secretory pathway pseudopilin PulG
MNKNKLIQSDSAVSEVVGYTLVFGIVVLAIGLIYVAGIPALQSTTDAAQFKSVEQGFMILNTDIRKVAFDQSPVRTTKLGTAEGGTLASDPAACNISIKIFDGAGTERFNHTIELGRIEFVSGVGSISCENGAVITRYGSGSIMTIKPRMFKLDQDQIMFSLIKVNDSSRSASGGISQVTISNPRFNESLFNTPEVYENGEMAIKVDSEYADSWARFLSSEFGATFNQSDGSTGWCNPRISFEKLVVVEYVVSVDIW